MRISKLMNRWLWIGFLLVRTLTHSDAAEPKPPFVSELLLISSTRDFDNVQLTVSGWLYLQVEDGKAVAAWLFPTPDHARVSDFPSSVIIDFPPLRAAIAKAYPRVPIESLHGAYIVFTATFHAKNLKAPFNLGIGELNNVTEVSMLTDVQKIKSDRK